MDFFSKLGFAFNPQFTGEEAACMILGDHMFAMLLTHDHFRKFTCKAIADATQVTEVLIAISANSRDEVDRLCDLALSHGATSYADPADYGFMYQRSFADLDGHQWEVGWMDPAHVQPIE
jgi:hypothetical protein